MFSSEVSELIVSVSTLKTYLRSRKAKKKTPERQRKAAAKTPGGKPVPEEAVAASPQDPTTPMYLKTTKEEADYEVPDDDQR